MQHSHAAQPGRWRRPQVWVGRIRPAPDAGLLYCFWPGLPRRSWRSWTTRQFPQVSGLLWAVVSARIQHRLFERGGGSRPPTDHSERGPDVGHEGTVDRCR